jgi:hypothetical protein
MPAFAHAACCYSGERAAGYQEIIKADQKRPDARRPKFRRMRRTIKYAAMRRKEGNDADGRFSSADQDKK